MHDALACGKPRHLLEARLVGAFRVDDRSHAHVDERVDHLQERFPVVFLELLGVHEAVHALVHPEHDALDGHVDEAEVLQVLDLQIGEFLLGHGALLTVGDALTQF